MDFSGKLSLYDFLTMLVCGFMILALFIPLPSEEHQWIILIIFSYLIGLVYHRMLEFIRAKICECKCKYFCTKKSNQIETNSANIKENTKKCSFFSIKKLCLIFKTIFCSNYNRAIFNAFKEVYRKKNRVIKDKYYKAYYSIMDKPCYSNIKLLEAQEAFLRNITWIVVAYVVAILIYNCCNYCNCCTGEKYLLPFLINWFNWPCLIIVVIVILFARYRTQMSIYKLVWEGYKYTHNNKNNTNNMNNNTCNNKCNIYKIGKANGTGNTYNIGNTYNMSNPCGAGGNTYKIGNTYKNLSNNYTCCPNNIGGCNSNPNNKDSYDNKNNPDSKENLDNKDNPDNKNNPDSKDNPDNKDNLDNKDSSDNKDNPDNKNNLDTSNTDKNDTVDMNNIGDKKDTHDK